MIGEAIRVPGGWFGGPSDVTSDTFLALLEQHARATPSTVAIDTGEERVSYGALLDEMHDVARRLALQPGAVVAVRMTQSTRSLALLLGALRAGAVCLALDPVLPSEREAAILAHVRPAAILDENDPLASPRGPLPSMPAATDAAYVVFTSGTTGTPKGVIVRHGGLVDTAVHSARWFGLGAGTRLLCTASWTFDAAWWELAVALSAGATVARSRLQDAPARLLDVDAALMTPSVARWATTELDGLQCFGMAGEAPDSALIDRLSTGAERVLNLYGPAEASICVSIGELSPDGVVHAGRPLPGVYAYVLDDGLGPVADGTPGQLYVSGRCVGAGYLGDASQTAERFVVDPFREDERMYATGDLAAFDAHGRLVLHGRVDEQVKIRGVRIEMEEVAAVLRAVDGISDVAVCPFMFEGSTMLGAMLVADADVAGADLLRAARTACRERLHDAMVPRAWVWRERLPIRIGGKLDRAAVAAALCYGAESGAAEDLDDDRTPVQRIVATSLSAGHLDLDKGLLDQGLDSLGAVRLAAELNATLGTTILAADVMAAVSVRSLEQYVLDAPRAARSDAVASSDRPSPGQSRLFHLWRADPESLAYNVPFTLDIHGPVAPTALCDAVRHVLGEHDELRARFVEDPDLRVQIFDEEIEVAHIHLTDGEDPERLAARTLEDLARLPFALDAGPLARATVVEIGPEHSRVALVIHHVAVDGTSAALIAKQIFDRVANEATPVEHTVEHAYREHAHRASRRAERERGRLGTAWSEYLDGVPDVLELPFMAPPRTEGSVESRTVTRHLAPNLARALQATANDAGSTLFHVLLTAYGELLRSWAGTGETLVAVLASQRPTVHDRDTVGFFVETIPVRVPRMTASPRQAVQATRDATIRAMALAALPFEDIVADVSPTRIPGRMPLTQAAINVFALPEAWTSGDGRVSGSLGVPLPSESKFDVLLYVHPAEAGIELRWAFRADMVSQELGEALADQLEGLLHAMAGGIPNSIVSTTTTTTTSESTTSSESITARVTTGTIVDARGIEHDVAATAQELLVQMSVTGIGPHSLVAIYAERTPTLAVVVATLHERLQPWIIIDPAWPSGLQEQILAQLRPAATVRLTPRLEVVARPDATDPPMGTGYVATTSGTTGSPRFVLGDGAALDEQVAWHRQQLHDAEIRVAMSSGLSYDPLLRDILVPLMSGGLLVIPDAAPAEEPAAFLDLLEQHRITVLHTTPGILGALGDVGHLPVPDVRLVLLGGETLTTADAETARALFPSARIFNVYGSTETPQIASAFEWSPAFDAVGASVAVGAGRSGSYLLVVDERGDACPVGVLGEVAVESSRLAGGYWDGTNVTPLPSGGRPGRYLTGDLGRVDAAGNVYLAGRRDHQVKVDGVRVELTGIETIASSVDGVQRVTVRPVNAGGDSGLVAIVQPTTDAHPAQLAARVEERLTTRLGAGIVPQIVITSQPVLTASGKIDVAATIAAEQHTTTRVNWTGTELDIAETWSELIGAAPSQPTSSFFHLGGTSLTALRMLRRIEERFGIKVPAASFFRAPTPRALASFLEEATMRALLEAHEGGQGGA